MNTVRTKLSVKDIMLTKADRRALDALQVRNLQQFRGWTAQMETDVVRAVSDGVTAGENIDKISGRISDAIGASKTRARRIARTESINAAVEGARNRYREYGIEQVEVIACDDWRTCEICQQHDGKIYSVDDDAHMPPYHPNCRCAIKAVVSNPDKKKPVTKLPTAKVPNETFDSKTANLIMAAKDYRTFEREANIAFGKNILSSDIKNLDFPTIQKSLARFVDEYEDTPEMFAKCDKILTASDGELKGGLMGCAPNGPNGNYVIVVNRMKFSPDYVKVWSQPETQEYIKKHSIHPKGTDSRYDSMVHEGGHAKVWTIICRVNDNKWGASMADWNDNEFDTNHTAQRILADAVKNAAPSYSKGTTRNKMLNNMAKYAASNPHEAIAEAYTDCRANGKKAKPISIELVKICDQLYSE